MANRRRDLLHKNKLDDFVAFMADKGWDRVPSSPQASFEAARFVHRVRRHGDVPIILYDRNTGDHLTTFGKGTSMVHGFIQSRKPQES